MKYLIGEIVYDTCSESLHCNGEVLRPRMKVLMLLKSLLENPGKVVTRDELIETIWDGNYLTGSKALNSVVYTLRSLLNESKSEVNAIETIPKRGYRLVVAVTEVVEEKNNRSSVKLSAKSLLNRVKPLYNTMFASALAVTLTWFSL